MKKKIVFFLDGLNFGGVENVVMQLVSHIDLEKFEPYVIRLYKDQNELEGLFPANVKLYTLPFSKKNRGFFFYLLYFRKLCLILREISPDIIHSHNSSFSYFYLVCATKVSLCHVKNIRTIHFSGFFFLNKNIKDRVRLFFDKLATKISKTIVVVLTQSSYHMIKKMYVDVPIQCIPNGVDCDKVYNPDLKKEFNRSLLKIPDKAKVIIYVARLVDGKNHITLLNAWKKVNRIGKYNAYLLIVGDGELLSDMKSYVYKCGINDSVIFTGGVSNVVDYLSISDIGVFPSLSEGFGLVLLEKMAMGLPTIVSNIQTFLSLVKDYETAIFYDVLNPSDLSDKIIYLLEHESLCKEIGNNARQLVKQKYSLDKMCESYVNIYDAQFD